MSHIYLKPSLLCRGCSLEDSGSYATRDMEEIPSTVSEKLVSNLFKCCLQFEHSSQCCTRTCTCRPTASASTPRTASAMPSPSEKVFPPELRLPWGKVILILHTNIRYWVTATYYLCIILISVFPKVHTSKLIEPLPPAPKCSRRPNIWYSSGRGEESNPRPQVQISF